MSDSPPAGILVFVKAPEPGKVKTRLGKSIGLDHACQLYRCFGLDLLNRLQSLNLPLLIFYAPDHEKASVQGWLKVDAMYPQGLGSLGDRMRHAFETGFRQGLHNLMILGSDSPDVPLDVIRQGLDALQSDHTVIGPSNDGGYYTIGFSQQSWCPQAFHNIQWSSECVYPDTVKILRSQSAAMTILPKWDDIDTLSDLQGLYSRNLQHNHLPLTLHYIQENLLDWMPDA